MEPQSEPGSAVNPKDLPFALQNGERVLQLARRHPVFLWVKVVGAALAGIVPVAILLVVVGMTAGLDGTTGKIVIGLAALWLLFWLVRVYFTWYRYNNDLWVVTNQRILDSTKFHWFHHRMASADLVNVEDLSINKEGVFPTMFNYGDVICQTSGTRPNFVLPGIGKPSEMLALVDSARDAARRELGLGGGMIVGNS